MLQGFLRSRKFWLAVAGVIAAAFRERLGLSEEQIQQIVLVLAALIFGIAYEDGQAKSSGGSGAGQQQPQAK